MNLPVALKSGFTHNSVAKNVNKIGAGTKYGLYLPHLVLVRSAITPIIGSLIASHSVEMNIISEAAAAGNSIVSVMNTAK